MGGRFGLREQDRNLGSTVQCSSLVVGIGSYDFSKVCMQSTNNEGCIV